MCSTCDCDSDPIQSGTEQTLPQACRKCGADPYISLDKVHVECKRCFLESCNRKIRSTIGKSKLLKNNEPILIAHSGGASSSALLDLIKNSIEFNARREQKFRPSIIHVDTQLVSTSNFNVNRDERIKKLIAFLSLIHEHYPEWPIYCSTLEMCSVSSDTRSLYFRYDTQETLLSGSHDLLICNNQAQQKFVHQLESMSNLTDQQDYLKKCTKDLIVNIASAINSSFSDPNDRFRYLFDCSNSTKLANDLLVNVILGRGASIKSTVSICDKSQPIPVMRPMREFSMKEIMFYLRAKDIKIETRSNLATLSSQNDSIQKATEAFLGKLDVDYTSTYSTLLKTGNKMQD